nr:hypothetical protein [Mycobacterium sp. ELW1]
MRGVTRSDVYFARVDDNPCVNMMTQQNLHDAVDSCARRSAIARPFGANDEETTYWRDRANHMMMPFNRGLGVHE